jgi:hypothetical protein
LVGEIGSFRLPDLGFGVSREHLIVWPSRIISGVRLVTRPATVLVGLFALLPHLSAQQRTGAQRPEVVRSTIRTPDGRSDLQGIWTTGTATPLERPAEFADKPSLTEAEAAAYEKSGYARLLKKLPQEEIPVSGDLDESYLDTSSFKLAGNRRTSLIVVPANGKLPGRVPGAKEEPPSEGKRFFDGPESFDLEERCLMTVAFGSSNATPPLIPNPFGLNFYQIVQTPASVMILSELIHDVRIIRIGGRHLPPSVRLWRGDSIGHWEKDTLVAETTNFSEKSRYGGSSEQLRVVERFARTDAFTISYRVTVEDRGTWVTPWTADIPFKAAEEKMFEFACHEGNYSIANALRGARTEEKEGR